MPWGRKTGGQPGHEGRTLERVPDPDQVEELSIDRRTLPKGKKYTRLEDEVRQVIEITVSREVTEYRAEVLQDEDGRQYMAEFPEGVSRPVQYGPELKGQVVYFDIEQLLPFARIQEYFREEWNHRYRRTLLAFQRKTPRGTTKTRQFPP